MNLNTSIDNNYIYKYLSNSDSIKGIIHITHGKGEHIKRYSWLIDRLNTDGYHVISIDHRGHGRWIKNGNTKGIFAEKNGWKVITQDLIDLINNTNQEYPHLNQYLFAHSMGSWVGLSVVMQDTILKGLIISGSSKFPNFLMNLQKFIIKLSIIFFGKYATNPLMQYLTDYTWNKKFKPNRTTHDWISSDPDNVDDYVGDDLCGFEVTNSMWGDIADGCSKAFDKRNYSKVKSSLPIILISGTNDPVSDFGKGMENLYKMLKQIFTNVQNISMKGEKHEVFSGLRKDEAYNSLKSFLKNIT